MEKCPYLGGSGGDLGGRRVYLSESGVRQPSRHLCPGIQLDPAAAVNHWDWEAAWSAFTGDPVPYRGAGPAGFFGNVLAGYQILHDAGHRQP